MKCPFCDFNESKVIDSRPTDDGYVIRRRRECLDCQNRFTTYEKVEDAPIVIVKKDGTRESFSRMKVMNGVIRACEKRPVSVLQMESLIDNIEKNIHGRMEKETTSHVIGEYVMEGLKDLDEVSYVRFASVYRQFKDINTFVDELTKLLAEKKDS